MLILPLHKKPTRGNVPLVTLALLLLNLVVYFGLQAGDRDIEREAVAFYHDSELYETEWQWFEDYVTPTDQPHWQHKQEANELLEHDMPSETIAFVRARTVEAHPDFLDRAEDGAFADRDSDAWSAWHESREAYDAIRAESFTERHLLRYDTINPTGLFVHMFMHGDIMHLLGNMVFLVLLGLLVEGALGRGVYLGGYLLCGLGAAAASMAVHWGAATGMLGASGAIAGLMGLYAVLYGRRRVRFFYWFFVYFDYVRAPAIVLLPLWLGWEVFQYLWAGPGNVAYEAHVGGMVTGALIALGIRRFALQDDAFLEEDTQRDADLDALEHGRDAIAQARPDHAKRALRPLVDRHPDDTGVLASWYAACKMRAEDPDYHDAAWRILSLHSDAPDGRALVVETLRDYLAQDRPRLDPSHLVGLSARLARWGELDEARRLLDGLLRLPRPPGGTAEACLAVGRRLSGGEAVPYLELAERLAASDELRRAASRLLRG